MGIREFAVKPMAMKEIAAIIRKVMDHPPAEDDEKRA